MKYGSSIRSRHFVVKIDKGEEFNEALHRLCGRERIKAGTFYGFGSLCSAELQEFNTQKRVFETSFKCESSLHVPMIQGNISMLGNELVINTQCVIKYSIFGQVHMISGQLFQARVHCLELHLTMFDDLYIERSYDLDTGLAPWSRIQNAHESDYSYSDSSMAIPSLSSSSRFDLSANLEDSGLSRKDPTIIRRNLRGQEESSPSTEPSLPPAVSSIPEDEVISAALKSTDDEAASIDSFEASTRGEWLKAKRRQAAAMLSGDSNSSVLRASAEKSSISNTSAIKVADVLEHPTLGTCIVEELVDDDTVRLRVEKSDDIKSLKLKYFTLELVGKKDSVQIFKLMNREDVFS